MLRHILIAVQFLTVFRVRDDLAETPMDLAASVAWFPVAGLGLGGVVALFGFLFASVFPATVTGFLMVLVLTLGCQGLHLDGLADTADAMFSHRDRDRKMAIMKDSAVGVFGALALIFAIGLKALLLSDLAYSPHGAAVVLLFPVWGRMAGSVVTSLGHYARAEGGLGQAFVELAGPRELMIAGGMALLFSIVGMGIIGLISSLSVALFAVVGVEFWRRKMGGITGDIIGATIETSEIFGLLVASMLVG
jgi:adenosylcobinamide-GDP ribazoletransferase